jgi:hypothetical protein
MSDAQMQWLNVNDCASTCDVGCECSKHRESIDRMYNGIVFALQMLELELNTVPRVPCNSLKPFWNDHLDALKDKSVFWGKLGQCGSPKIRSVD